NDEAAIKTGNEAMTITPEERAQAAKDYPIVADLAQAARNAPGNAKEIIQGSVHAIEHPVQTLKDIGKMSSGLFPTVLRKLGVSEEFVNRYNAAAKEMYSYDENAEKNFVARKSGGEETVAPASEMNNEEMMNELKVMISDTLKDPEKLKQVVIEHPVDVALLFTGLLGGASKTNIGNRTIKAGTEFVEDVTKKTGQMVDEGVKIAGEAFDSFKATLRSSK